MGNGMNRVLPGIYVGNFRDSRDEKQLKENRITHILSIHDNAKPTRSDMVYLCLDAKDVGSQDLTQYFSQCNDFIHSARIYGGNVLIHCLAGMSRSVTLTVAYIMTVTSLGWKDALNVVRASRTCASPNFGFQKQLLNFQHEAVCEERKRLPGKFPDPPELDDEQICQHQLDEFACQEILQKYKKSRTNPEGFVPPQRPSPDELEYARTTAQTLLEEFQGAAADGGKLSTLVVTLKKPDKSENETQASSETDSPTASARPPQSTLIIRAEDLAN